MYNDEKKSINFNY